MKPRVIIVTFGLALVLALGFVFQPDQAESSLEKLPFFEAAFGFAGCLLLLLVAKVVGHIFLQKREDYYDE
jgi:ABC-type transport system involved in cytochrome c biogenesis permease component